MIVIAGAGIIGAAIAHALRGCDQDVVVLEREAQLGCGISSRNSGVIHGGLYYPSGSLKERLCKEGRELLYRFCKEQAVPHEKIGKYLVAQDVLEENYLQQIKSNAGEDVPLYFTSQIPGSVSAKSALFSPETGILDVHGMITALLNSSNAAFLPGQCVESVEQDGTCVRLRVNGEVETCDLFINACGLDAPMLAGMSEPRPYAKGSYFRITSRPPEPITSLIYPAIPKNSPSLGTHLTVDLQGTLLLGPNLRWVEEMDYNVDISEKKAFFDAARRFLPWLRLADLEAGFVGYRPKLAGPEFRDFSIKRDGRIIHCLGIESPGITASMAIGKYVKDLLGFSE